MIVIICVGAGLFWNPEINVKNFTDIGHCRLLVIIVDLSLKPFMASKKRGKPEETPQPGSPPEIKPGITPEEPMPAEEPEWYPEEPANPAASPEIEPPLKECR